MDAMPHLHQSMRFLHGLAQIEVHLLSMKETFCHDYKLERPEPDPDKARKRVG